MTLPPLNLNLAQNTSSGVTGEQSTGAINFKSAPITGAPGINWTVVVVAALAVVAVVLYRRKG